MDPIVNLDSLEKIHPTVDDLALFKEKDPLGACRFNAPIPYGDAPELKFII